jgi:hypothetical protein
MVQPVVRVRADTTEKSFNTTLNLLKSTIKLLIADFFLINNCRVRRLYRWCPDYLTLFTTALKVRGGGVFLHNLSHIKPMSTDFPVHVSRTHFAAQMTSYGLD